MEVVKSREGKCYFSLHPCSMARKPLCGAVAPSLLLKLLTSLPDCFSITRALEISLLVGEDNTAVSYTLISLLEVSVPLSLAVTA